jgi:predicted nucleic acid-binding protein
MAGRQVRLAQSRALIVDTGWIIAAERNSRAAMVFRKRLAQEELLLAFPAVVAVEAIAGSTNQVVTRRELNNLLSIPLDFDLAVRSGALQAAVRRLTGQDVGSNDPQVAATAEASSGVIYTGDSADFQALRSAGAQIEEARPLPF